jgi:hypothetical protein
MGAEQALVGVSTIKFGACGAAGTMGTTLVAIGIIVPDSTILTLEAANKTDIYVEDYDAPFLMIPDPKRIQSFEFSVRDMSAATLAKAMGGTVLTTKWSQAVGVAILEQSIEITSVLNNGKQHKICIPRANVRGSVDGKFSKTDTATLKFTCDVLVPVNGSMVAQPAVTWELI